METVKVTDETRTPSQNDLLWPLLRDISRQVFFTVSIDGHIYRKKIDPESVKAVMIAGLKRQKMMVEAVDGGWVMPNLSTRNLKKDEFSELIELTKAFGDTNGVKWSATTADEERLLAP